MARLNGGALSLVWLLAAAAPALAETAPPPPPDPGRDSPEAIGVVDEAITVTARRRAENVQDVPIAISTVDARALEATGSYNVNRLTQLLPSVQFFSSNPRNSNINIRGLGAPFGLTNDGIEQGVGLYIDQVYYSRPAAASFDFVDVERIEALRGPQGTLYGKNTTAGAINITSRAPSFTPEGRVELSGGNLDFFQGKVSLSGPIVADKLAVRLAVTGTTRRGTLFNVATGRWVNEQSNVGGRLSFLWQPTAQLSVTLQGDLNHQNPECCTQVYVSVAPTQRSAARQYAGLSNLLGYRVPSTNPFERLADSDAPLQAKQDFGGASLRIERQFGIGTLTSVTAFRFWNWYPSSDRDFIGLPITTISANPSKQKQYTQEFRFASDGKGRFDFVIGAFAYRQTIDNVGQQQQGSAASVWLLGPPPAGTSLANWSAILNGYRQDARIAFENNSLALFGQVTWRLTDKLRIEPGLRVNYDDKYADYNATVSGGIANPTPAQLTQQRGILSPQAYKAKFDDVNVSGDVRISWEPADNVLLYVTYARAFKTGGVNLGGLPLDANNQPALSAATVKPETVNHYELGVKSQLLDRAVTLNLAIFQTDIADYQTTVINGQVGVLRGYLANARGVQVRGGELELSARPSERLSLYGTATLLDGRYTNFPDAPCPVEFTGGPQVCDASGTDLPGVSRWAASYGGEYRFPLGGSGLKAYVGMDGSYRSSFSSNPVKSPYVIVNGYAITNFRIGLTTRRGFDVFGWVRNAFDARYFDFLTVQPGNSGLIVGQPGDQRTFGGTIRKSF